MNDQPALGTESTYSTAPTEPSPPTRAEREAEKSGPTIAFYGVLVVCILAAAAIFAGAFLYRAAGGRERTAAVEAQAEALAQRDELNTRVVDIKAGTTEAIDERTKVERQHIAARRLGQANVVSLDRAVAAAAAVAESDAAQVEFSDRLLAFLADGDAVGYNANVGEFNSEYLDEDSPGVTTFAELQAATEAFADNRRR